MNTVTIRKDKKIIIVEDDRSINSTRGKEN